MAAKADIQATIVTATTVNAIIAQPVRLKGIILAGLATSGTVQLKTTSATGTTLFEADVPAGDITSLNISEDGILFPYGIYVSTFTVSKATLLTDKYSTYCPVPTATHVNGSSAEIKIAKNLTATTKIAILGITAIKPAIAALEPS